MSILSKRVFSAQDGSRKNLKHFQNRLEMSFLDMFLKVLYNVCSLSGNVKCPIIQFLKNDEIVFHLAAMNQCEKGGEGHILDSAHED